MKKIFIEITTEELPAIPFLRELANIKPKMAAALERAGAECGEIEFDYTPRRFVFSFSAQEFSREQCEEFWGAPRAVALAADGTLSAAGQGFLKKCGAALEEISWREKGGKECMYYERRTPGAAIEGLLSGVVNDFVASLNFGKSMRWGTGEFSFIRPIKSLCVMSNDELVPAELFGQKSAKKTFVHRNISAAAVEFASQAEYHRVLHEGKVVLKAADRRALVLEQIAAISKQSGLRVEIDEELLDEVVAITEYPNALLGEFDREFLAVAPEVIVLSMKDNQRYFAVYKGQALSNHFVAVSNSFNSDLSLIRAGNEKVLRARLSDALFFWQNDLKIGLQPELLGEMGYMKELGSMSEKAAREEAIALALAPYFDYSSKENIRTAARLAKADLRTQMVGEFPELQGIIGGYYAAAAGANIEVASAIKEQYLPSGDGALPGCVLAKIIALAGKFDALCGLFSIGKLPSGNKDPYALRRAALGILRILTAARVRLNLRDFLASIAHLYAPFDREALLDFINDRFGALVTSNASLIAAVLRADDAEPLGVCERIQALQELSREADFAQNLSTFKRLVNVIKDAEVGYCDETKLSEGAEIALYKGFKALEFSSDVVANLRAIFSLRPLIDEFFERVMINVEDAAIKANRVALVGAIAGRISAVADLKEISFDD